MIGATQLHKPQPNFVTTSEPKIPNYSDTNLNNVSEGDISFSKKNISRPRKVLEPSYKYEAVKKAARGRRMSDNFSDVRDVLKQRRLSEHDRDVYLKSQSSEIENENICALDNSLEIEKQGFSTIPRYY